MKLFRLCLLIALLGLLLPVATSAYAPPQSSVSTPSPTLQRQASFLLSYTASSDGRSPLAFVELWVRTSTPGFCGPADWALALVDAACTGEHDCSQQFSFTAPGQGVYQFKSIIQQQNGERERKDSPDSDWVQVDYAPPTVGETNPRDGAVVYGTINVGAYFGDSFGLVGVWIGDETYYSFNREWLWTPSCAAPPAGGEEATALGQTGLPSGVYSTQWDTTQAPDGPVQLAFTARDVTAARASSGRVGLPMSEDRPDLTGVTVKTITVIVNNGSARQPKVLSAVNQGGQVTFQGLVPPPQEM
ncbi:MAG: hypothetical protein GX605_07510, partial [Chloroflexi bacterium]|nr:hypothetical protein [Chloroflexota bacterium]